MTDAKSFADDWIAAWNTRDLERVLAHYTDDFEMSSPYIQLLMKEPSGMLRGKDAVRAYWAHALSLHAGLHFTLVEVLPGANTAVVLYRNQDDRLCCEAFFFNAEGKVYRAAGNYSEKTDVS